MRMSEAIKIAEAQFGAWVERDQLYFPHPHARRQWEEHCAAIDAARKAEEDRFEFNGKVWFGNPRGWDRRVF